MPGIVPTMPSSHFEVYLDLVGWSVGTSSQHLKLWHIAGNPDSIQTVIRRPITGPEIERHLRVMGMTEVNFMAWLAKNPIP